MMIGRCVLSLLSRCQPKRFWRDKARPERLCFIAARRVSSALFGDETGGGGASNDHDGGPERNLESLRWRGGVRGVAIAMAKALVNGLLRSQVC